MKTRLWTAGGLASILGGSRRHGGRPAARWGDDLAANPDPQALLDARGLIQLHDTTTSCGTRATRRSPPWLAEPRCRRTGDVEFKLRLA